MGYNDEAERSDRHRSRARQPVKRPGTREPEYRKREPKAKELNLITDTFHDYNNANYHGRSGKDIPRSRAAGKKDKSRRQTAATKQEGSAYYTPAKKKAQKKRRKLVIILLELVILISVVLFAAYSYLDKSMNKMVKLPWNPNEIKNVEISQEKQEQMKGYWTIAIFGVDSRNSDVGKGNNSDVNMICNINQDTGEIKLVSVYRDTYLNISDKNSYNKINSAYLLGGPDQAVKALNKNLDLDIDDYATFNWKAVADAINILGGIDLELTKSEFYYINAFVTETVKATGVPSEPVKHAGAVHLDGVQAVAYGRLRLMDTDYARTERQRKVIELAFEKAKKADWATLNNVIQTVFPQVSSSVELTDILVRARDITKYHLGETMGFPTEKEEVDVGTKGDCVIPKTLESNVTILHQFLFGDENYEPTDLVKSISKKITSDAGQAKAPKATTADKKNAEKSTAESSTDRTKEFSGTDYDESESGHETGSGKETGANRETGSTGFEKWETDENGDYIDPDRNESQSSAAKPGTGTTKPGTEGTKPSGGNPNTPGMGTDTGVILGPGAGNKPGSGNNNNNTPTVPGGGNTPNTPGSGGGNTPNAPGGGGGNTPNAPGSGGGNTPNAPGSGGGNTPNAPGSGGGNTPNAPGSGGANTPNAPGSGGSNTPNAPGSGNVDVPGPMGP